MLQCDFSSIINGRPLRFAAALFCFSAILFAAAPQNAAAAAPAAKSGSNTRIISDKMTYDSNKNQVIFEGKVHVTRPTMEIWSELLTVILDDSGKKSASSGSNALGAGGGKVERIIAEKSVRIKQESKVGTCGKATYFVNEGRILMEQNPVIVDGDNRISGKTITYYTETGRSVVTGDPGKKVEVLFSTDDNKSPVLPGVGPQGDSQNEPAGEKAQQ